MDFYFVYDSNGNIIGQPWQSSSEMVAPDGYNMLVVAEGDPTAQDAFVNPSFYTVQNGQLVQVSNYSQLQLQQAQQEQIALLRQGYEQTLAGGFSATIEGTAHTFGWQISDQINLNSVQSAIANNYLSYPVQYADINGNPVTLSSATDLQAIEQAATKFLSAQHQQVLTLIGQVQQATTVEAVQAIVWSAATY